MVILDSCHVARSQSRTMDELMGTLCCFSTDNVYHSREVSSNFRKHGPQRRHYCLSWTCRSRKNTWSPYLLKTNSYYVEIGGIASITFKQMLMFYLDPTLHQNLNCWESRPHFNPFVVIQNVLGESWCSPGPLVVVMFDNKQLPVG